MRILYTLTFILWISLLSAKNIDSLTQLYQNTSNQIDLYYLNLELSQAYQYKRIDSARVFAEKALFLANSFEIKNYTGKAYQQVGNILYLKGNFVKADSIYHLALKSVVDDKEIFNLHSNIYGCKLRQGKVNDGLPYLDKIRTYIGDDTTSNDMISYYLDMSTYHSERGEIMKKLSLLLKAKDLTIKNKQEEAFISMINYNLSIVYEAIKAFDQALKIYHENRRNAQLKKDKVDELFALYGISSSHLELKQYDKVKQYAAEAIALKEREDYSVAFGFIYFCLGKSYLAENQLDSAEYYINKGITISKRQNENKELSENYDIMGQLMFKKGNLEKAKWYASEAVKISTYMNYDLNSRLADLYRREGNYKKAYELMLINWSDWKEKEENKTEYKTISQLLNNKFKQEKLEEQQLFEEKLEEQKQWTKMTIFTIIGLLMSLIIFIQIKNNRKLKQLNTSLTNKNKTLQNFAYITSHDLKEPVRNIKSFSDILQRKLSEKENTKEEQEYLEFIRNGATTMNEVINSLKVYTEVSFNEVVYESVNLNDVFQLVEQNLAQTIQDKKGILTFNNPDQLTEVIFEKTILLILLQNLIQNGLTFNTSKVPTVNVTITKKDSHQHLFKISDNGIGIASTYLDHIFEPFKTLENKSYTNSSGLGLTICKNIIDNYNGKIWVESEEGIGSHIYFLF